MSISLLHSMMDKIPVEVVTKISGSRNLSQSFCPVQIVHTNCNFFAGAIARVQDPPPAQADHGALPRQDRPRPQVRRGQQHHHLQHPLQGQPLPLRLRPGLDRLHRQPTVPGRRRMPEVKTDFLTSDRRARSRSLWDSFDFFI